jgi:hypothetical protein
MRYLRLFPLLVMACAAPAAADDHRVDLNAALSFCAGSTLTGFHISASASEVFPQIAAAEPKFTFVVDQSNHWGTHEDLDMSRNVTMVGGRLSLPVKGHTQWKVLPGLLTGWVHTSLDGDSTDALGLAPGIGVEWVSEYSRQNRAWGARANVDYVFITGAGDNFWRASFGGVLRFKKD